MHIPYSTSGAIINVVRVINVHCDNTLTEGYIKTTISHNLLMNKAIFFFFFFTFFTSIRKPCRLRTDRRANKLSKKGLPVKECG